MRFAILTTIGLASLAAAFPMQGDTDDLPDHFASPTADVDGGVSVDPEYVAALMSNSTFHESQMRKRANVGFGMFQCSTKGTNPSSSHDYRLCD